ncbi:M56 family metallopeptidase [Candidatus Pseudoscillospira sp. SGI.172]|uniref:M56 family metallopeptidase n=1 Tax=Candidatus Pseudoscillospira sp. SGI.172 TaxID=3420582 RepID=UPI003D038CF2
MRSLWGFLVQTLTVSLVAALLLVVKELLADKLSPRWQYGIWGVLALRILMPVSMSRHVLLPVPLWVETWKGAVERTMDSAYAEVYRATSVQGPVPLLEGGPRSITDWLFVIYAAGVAAVLLWYAVSYLRLKRILRRGRPASEETRKRIQSVCTACSLRACRTVAVPGLPSAFVCGVFHPVLALPADTETDDKVLLHELLHFQHRDALQSVFWCVLRALHWCNPFLQAVFDRIGNDMESLCDQRVLERLEGEERREYGGILLEMANDRYPRVPGTTSVSNGGKNIARRITAIVRFKKYPKGMGLVSLCIAFVLAVPVLAGTAESYEGGLYRPRDTGLKFTQAMALARIRRCTTVAGALDTYTKGLMYENGIYIATASPLGRHEEIEAEIRKNVETENWVAYHLDAGDELEYLSRDNGYQVCNLDLQDDGSYKALIVFYATAFLNPDGEGRWCDKDGNAYAGCVAVPVIIRRENGWVVEERGLRQRFPGIDASALLYAEEPSAILRKYRANGERGSVEVCVSTCYTVDNTVEGGDWGLFGSSPFDETPKPNAAFDHCTEHRYTTYAFGGSLQQRKKLTYAAMESSPLDSLGDEPVFTGKANVGDSGWSRSGGSSGCGRVVTPDWDGTLTDGSGGTAEMRDGLARLPAGYAVRLYWNGKAVEDFILEEIG